MFPQSQLANTNFSQNLDSSAIDNWRAQLQYKVVLNGAKKS